MTMKINISIFIVCLAGCTCFAAQNTKPEPFLSDQDGKLVYAADPRGNQIPDFSCCGYMGANQTIPNVPVRVVVTASDGDQTHRIQAALDYVAALPMDSSGIRGAVLLRKGKYSVNGGLKISSSGVVLRGEGMDENGTVLVAAGTDRRTLIQIAGKNDRKLSGTPLKITDEYVPVGACRFSLDDTKGIKVGNSVCIIRPSTKEWVSQTGMDQFGGGLGGTFSWKPGSRDMTWDRTITAIDDDSITVDAPITTAIEAAFGGAVLRPYDWPGRISHVGVENLCCQSEYNSANPKDEDHAWMAVTMENVKDAWVRQMAAIHFAGSAVAIYETCKQITAEDCLSLAPISEIGGYRRHTFFTMGQQTLFLRCWSEQGKHDFSTGHCAAGPNAFVQCHSLQSLDDSGPVESWAAGVLYDNVRIDGNALRLGNRGSRGQGLGWAAANSVLWNCQAAVIECDMPPTAANWAFGCWAEFEGAGYWQQSNNVIRPQSLYVTQLQERNTNKNRGQLPLGWQPPKVDGGHTVSPIDLTAAGGSVAATHVPLLTNDTQSSTSPSEEMAEELTLIARKPAETLREFIEKASVRNPIPTDSADAKSIDAIFKKDSSDKSTEPLKKITLLDGRIICDDRLLTGGSIGIVWWRGNIRPDIATTYGVGVTRFVPGRTGPGFTDDLNELTDAMITYGQTILEHNYGLWYDRRRDDHQHIRRMNGDVRPPFYEQPFARSGTGAAFDGLSLYDLTKYNLWYWKRLKDFADYCDHKGLVLLHQNYFQHNIIEAAAHWADFPWRTANNINQTGFPEPPFYAGEKRVFMDEFFYDTKHPTRTPLHQAYIRQCMNNFADNTNVIQLIGKEYTGPVEFVQFWLDTILAWEKDTGRKQTIGLSCTKDVQDAILADPKRAQAISVIDIRYWWYQANGKAYAPQGGQHLAPRQHARQLKPKSTLFAQVVRAVKEYRDLYPDKAVIYSADNNFGWAVLMGGGSIPKLPQTADKDLLKAAARMKPYDLPENPEGQFALAEPGQQYLIYANFGQEIAIDLTGVTGDFTVSQIELETGTAKPYGHVIPGGGKTEIDLTSTPCLLWLKRK